MAELYNQVKQSNSKYIPKFIGSNFDTLKAVGDTLENRYKRNKDLSDSLAIQIANDRYFDKDKHIGDKHYNNLSKTIEEVSSNDQNFENSGQVISQAVKDYATDRTRLAALDNAKRYNEYLDLKHKYGSEGVDFTERKNQNFFNQGTVDENGNLNRFEHALEKRLDYNTPKEKLFNDIEPDLIPLISKYNPKTGQIEGGVTETNKNKIRNYLGQAFNRYKQDARSEYNQEKEVLRNQGIPENQIDTYIAKSIVDVGQEKVLNRTRLSGENASHQFLSGLFPQEEDNNHQYEETQGIEYKPDLINLSKLRNQVGGRKTVGQFSNYSIPKEDEQLHLNNDQDAAKQYLNLNPEEKKKFDRIVGHFDKNIKPNSLKAFNIVNDYIDNIKKNEVNEKTPIITSDYVRVGEDGRSTREDATKDLAANYTSRTFYNPQTGEKISGSDPKFLKKLGYSDKDSKSAHEQFKDDLTVRGEYSPKNLFTKFADSDHFVDPLAVTINGKDYAVTRPISNRNTNAFRTRKIVNDAYKALKETPGIENEVTIEGIPFNIGEYKDEQNGGNMYVLETKDKSKRVIVKELEDLPKALQAEFSK